MKRSGKIVAAVVALGLVLNLALVLVLTGGQGDAAGFVNGAAPAPQVLVLRIYFKTMEERNILAVRWDAIEANTQHGYLTVWANQTAYDEMKAQGVRVEIDQKTTAMANAPKQLFGQHKGDDTCPADVNFCGGYRTVEEMQSFFDQQVAAHPGLVQKVDFGNSWCKDHAPCVPASGYSSNGYDLWAMHITNQSIPGPKPVFWYTAGIHAREIAVHEIGMNYVQYLLDNYDTNADVHWLVDYHDIWVVPMLNPDGHHQVENGGSPNSAYYQRKNGNYVSGSCTTWPPSASSQKGVDLNRNYRFQWGQHNGSSGAVCSQTYRGPSAGSEPEVISETAYVRSLIADANGSGTTEPTVNLAPLTTTGIFQSMHSNAALNLYPWGGVNSITPNNTELRNISNHMSAVNAGGSGYLSEQSIGLYATDGTSADWGYGELGIASFTTEVDGNDFFVPYDYTQNTLWPENRGALLYEAKIARYPYLLAHGPDVTGTASIPLTVTQGVSASLLATIQYNWTANTLSQNVGAAEYYLDTPPWITGSVGISMTAVDGSFNSTNEQAQASIATSGLSFGRHIIFMRGRGATDYQGFQTWGPITAAFLTVVDPNGTPTATPVQPTVTSTVPAGSTATNTAPAGSTATSTVPAGSTATSTAPAGSTATSTVPAGSTATSTVPAGSTATSTAVVTPTATSTAVVSPTATACAISFSDVPTSNIFYGDITFLACRGVINGFPGGTFRPNANTSRGQFAKIAALGFSLPAFTPTSPTFSDVPASYTFYQYVEAAVHAGAISGFPGGTFRPNANISRVETVVIVQRIRNYPAFTPTSPTFSDVPATAFGYQQIETLAHVGIIGGATCAGGSGTCFRPNSSIARGELSKVVHQAITTAPLEIRLAKSPLPTGGGDFCLL